MHGNIDRARELLKISSKVLANRPFQTVDLELLSDVADVSLAEFTSHYSDMHALGVAILTYEGSSMRQAHRTAITDYTDPFDQLEEAFRLVGHNLANDLVVRAGIKIAAEASRSFPERNIDPFRTWSSFVEGALETAKTLGIMRPDVSVHTAARTLVAAGMGTKDLLAFTDTWSSAPERLAEVARFVIDGLRRV